MKIRWSRLALRDLDSALAYITERNPSAARGVSERIEAAAAALSQHPRIGRPGRIAGTRELVVSGTPLIVAYRVRPDAVEIIGMIHGARQWPDHL